MMMMMLGCHDGITGRGSTDMCNRHMPLQSFNSVPRTRREMEWEQFNSGPRVSDPEVFLQVCFLLFPMPVAPEALRIEKLARSFKKEQASKGFRGRGGADAAR